MRRFGPLVMVFGAVACRGSRQAPSGPVVVTSAPVDAVVAETIDGAPSGLECLARHFVGTPEKRDGRWGLVLPDGRTLPWDDGRTKTLDEKLDAPDLEDMLSIAYPRSAIAPVTDAGQDPGRIRVSALFEATYGATREAVRARLVPWTFRGATLLVHERALPAFQRVAKRLQDPSLAPFFQGPFFEGMGGTFNFRPIAGTNRPSAHSFGISLDLNPARSHYWRNDPKAPWKNAIPAAIVDAFEAEGFVWGGRWFHYDTMHFEWRPELFDCR